MKINMQMIDATYERKGEGYIAKSKKPRLSAAGDTLISALDGLRAKLAERYGKDEVEDTLAGIGIKAVGKDEPESEWELNYPPSEVDAEAGSISWRRKYSNGHKGGHVDVLIWFIPPVEGPPSMQHSASGDAYDVVIQIDAANDHLLGGAGDLAAAMALADEKATPTAQMWGFGGWAHEEN